MLDDNIATVKLAKCIYYSVYNVLIQQVSISHNMYFITVVSFQEIVRPRSKGRKEMFYLTTHSTHFIYGYMASGIW